MKIASQQGPEAGSTAPLSMNARPAIIGGLVVILLIFGGFGGWAAMAQLSSAVIAPAVVTVDSHRKAVKHLEGGIVRTVEVRNGDRIRAGDSLIHLDNTRAAASLKILSDNLNQAQAAEARLFAERNAGHIVSFPSEITERLDDSEVVELMRGQVNLFRARRESLDGETEIYLQRIEQIQQEIDGLTAQKRSKDQQLQLVEEELEPLRRLYQRKLTPKSELLKLEREAARLEGERGEHVASIARAKESINEARLQILQLQKGFRERVEEELRQISAQVLDLRERVNAAAFTLSQMEITAPVDGVVVDLQVHATGAVIQPGEKLLDIVPTEDDLVIEAQLRPLDIDSVAPGLLADVRFTAFPQRNTPVLNGQVIYVSADALEDQRSGQTHYLAQIAVSEAEVARLGARKLQPGMPAEVMIKTGDRTALDYLVQPLRDSITKAWRES